MLSADPAGCRPRARQVPPDTRETPTPTGPSAQDVRRHPATNRLVGALGRAWPPLKRAWPALRWLLGLGLLALAVDVLAGDKSEMSGIATILDHLRWWWIAPAIAAEAASELSFVITQTRLMTAGGLRPPLLPLTGMTLASQAMTNSVPGGPAVAAVYGFRWYRRLGADDTLAGWALVGTSIFAALSLALLAGVGLVFATEEGASLDLVPAVVGTLVATIALGVIFVYERPLELVVRWMLRTSHRLVGRPRGDHEEQMLRLLARIAAVRLRTPQALAVIGWAFMNWVFDCTCFGLAFLATGSPVPWKGLLLAYGAGQLAANLPITPGGLGAVEGSITIALAYFGGGTTADIAAVLIYRLISFWLVVLVGWGSWAGLALQVRQGRWARSALRSPVEPHVMEVEGRGAQDGGCEAEPGLHAHGALGVERQPEGGIGGGGYGDGGTAGRGDGRRGAGAPRTSPALGAVADDADQGGPG
jgi:putative heme transporter